VLTRFYAKPAFTNAVAPKSYLNRDDVTKRVINVLVKNPRINKKQIKPESHFVIDLGLEEDDTTDIIKLVEQEFAIEIPGL
jgi:acyl carrier protein